MDQPTPVDVDDEPHRNAQPSENYGGQFETEGDAAW